MLRQNSTRRTLRIIGGSIAVGTAAIGAYARVIRPWALRWGANAEEEKRVLPGDDFVPNPRMGYTRAITINAPIEQVWEWVVQIGQDRGGLYSYEWLENLFGTQVHNVDRVVPEFQNLQIGDRVPLYPNGPGYRVAVIEPPRVLVLRTMNPVTGEWTESVARDGVIGTWVFVLEPRVDKTTRLIVRGRLDFQPTRSAKAMWTLVEPVDFIMGRKTLLGIKERAEAHRLPDELLDRVMPEYEFRGVEAVTIHASPAQIFQALREVTLEDMPLAQAAGELRYLPGRLTGRMPSETPRHEPFMEVLLSTGNVVLAQEPDRELIIGAIGKFHDLFNQQFVPVHDADEFRRFLHADFQKLAMSVRVMGEDPIAGVTVLLEHRTHALSEHSRKQFARYWLAIKPGGGFAAQQLLHAVKARAEASAKKMREVKQPTRAEPQLVSA